MGMEVMGMEVMGMEVPGKRRRGRPKRGWLDNIRNDLSERELSGEDEQDLVNPHPAELNSGHNASAAEYPFTNWASPTEFSLGY